jgi:hypothetical protein
MFWDLAVWHALAKMRIHTEDTIELLEIGTRELAVSVAAFEYKVCPHFKTRELAKEVARRGRAQVRKKQKATAAAASKPSTQQSKAIITNKDIEVAAGDPRMRVFSVRDTYKFHRSADVARTIRRFGTSDNYSTQSVCLNSFGMSCISETLCRAKWSTRRSRLSTGLRIRTKASANKLAHGSAINGTCTISSFVAYNLP